MRQFGKQKEIIQEVFEQAIQLHIRPKAKQITAYLTNFKTISFHDKSTNNQASGLLCFFIDEEGESFKAYFKYNPYFYVGFKENYQQEVRVYIDNKFPKVAKVEAVNKIDLEELNHLSGRQKKYLKLSFHNINELLGVRKGLKKIIQKPVKKTAAKQQEFYTTLMETQQAATLDINEIITSIREYDIPYHSRVCIDTGLRAGKWFQFDIEDSQIVSLKARDDILSRPDLRVLAYDIETSKDPLKFPDSSKDCIIMISLMFDGEAYLIVNLGFCGQPVLPFSYCPKKQFQCNTTIFNEPSEKATLQKFFKLIRDYRPTVVTSFNGDKFDFPFVHERAKRNDLSMEEESGISLEQKGEYYGRYISHLDCFYWVERDAYLPQGSHGLKAVTREKLNYQPIEVDPENMVRLAKQETRSLAEYSISDAVATFFLYMKHIHDFIFALCTILPMTPDEVLRKGSGTLCENLLMAEAFNRNIIFPNKKAEQFLKIIDGKILDSQTYTGGKVECLRTGVYRADIQTQFHLNSQAIQTDLIDKLDQVLQHAIHSMQKTKDDVINYPEVRAKVLERLEKLRDVEHPSKHLQFPLIYHVDVASMYPNIILTNRLQPVAIVNDTICGSCMWNNNKYDCKRQLKWEWKGEYFPLNQAEMLGVQQILDNEVDKKTQEDQLEYNQSGEYQKQLKKRIRQYSQKTYKKIHISKSQIKNDTVCMLENSFYVDTVKAFRDRRYDFKAMVKKHKVIANKQKKAGNFKEAKEATEMMAFFDSLQLAHKIILNSYYGYVMRKGARWYSMEMAAMVTHIGGNIIGDCKNLIEKRFGKPLELDTDGIWLLLPKGFPENETFKLKNGGQSSFSYPCMVLNKFIFNRYKNPQYYRLKNEKTLQYERTQQMSIQFEIDGPYRAMFIPSAKEKQKTQQIDIHLHSTQLLKKRYVVFDFNGAIHQFKGFQIKRRGQLQLIKVLQDQIFDQYLKGKDLRECYEACANTAFKWLNILLKKGEGLTEDKLLGYVQQSKVLSKDLKEYGTQKGVAVTSAKRLSEFLGPSMIKGKGICSYYVISARPVGKPVTERAIPTSIFQAQQSVKRHFIAKWTGQIYNGTIHLKNILDWDYYKQRLQTMIQKMICIPAITQGLDNPLPMVRLPDWLNKKHYQERQFTQQRIGNFFQIKPKQNIMDIYKSARKQKQAGMEEEEPVTIQQPKQQPKLKMDLKQKAKKVNPFSLKTQFSKWLKVQKQLWTKGSQFNSQSFAKSSWHILQIIPKKSPGSFMVWYYSNGKISNCPLMLDRKYYLKSQKGQKKAPHSEGAAVQIQVDELSFIKQNQFYSTILNHQAYETRMPLQISFIISKGTVSKVNSSKHSYVLEDFTEQFSERYLDGIEHNFMNHLFLIEIVVLENKHTWLIVNPKLKEYVFVFVGKNARNQNYQKQAKTIINQAEAVIHNHSFQTTKQSLDFIEKYLKEYRQDSKNPFLAILQTQTEPQTLQANGVKSLYNEVPVLKLPKLQIEFQNITILDWQQKSIRVVVEISKSLTESVLKILGMSRYAAVPICNIAENQSLFDSATNIIYSRMMRAGGHLSWWNDFNSKIEPTYQSLNYTGKVTNYGFYTSYCIELDMVNLALISIAIGDDLNAEKNIGMAVNKKPSKVSIQSGSLDEMSTVQPAFNYLKEMIKAWIKDAHSGLKEADDLAENFPKWILTRGNALYDPILHRRVKHTMKKVIYMILLKLKDLGVKIIYSDFQRIIINTKKRTFNEALNNTKYLINKLHEQQKSYKDIPLHPLRVWNILLFKGPHNYSGFEVVDKKGTQRYTERWELANCFCPKIKQAFQRIMQDYLESMNSIIDQVTQNSEKDYVNYVMNFDQYVLEKQKQFILGKFCEQMLQVVSYLYQAYEKWRHDRNGGMSLDAESHEQPESEQRSQQSQQSQQNSFIDDQFQDEVQFKNVNKRLKLKTKTELDLWVDKHEIDILISNIFNQFKEPELEDQFIRVRKQCVQLLETLQKNTITLPKAITPVYPQFQIPCESCYRINEIPGNCSCGEKLSNAGYLQATVWKMMGEMGRDLYCSMCGRIQDDYLRKSCRCGGKWQFKERPLQWVSYTKREGQEWKFVNEVFEFIGVSAN